MIKRKAETEWIALRALIWICLTGVGFTFWGTFEDPARINHGDSLKSTKFTLKEYRSTDLIGFFEPSLLRVRETIEWKIPKELVVSKSYIVTATYSVRYSQDPKGLDEEERRVKVYASGLEIQPSGEQMITSQNRVVWVVTASEPGTYKLIIDATEAFRYSPGQLKFGDETRVRWISKAKAIVEVEATQVLGLSAAQAVWVPVLLSFAAFILVHPILDPIWRWLTGRHSGNESAN